MCVSIPVKILEIKKDKAIGNFLGKREEFNIGLVPDIKINDYVLASNGFIVKKISIKEAKEIFQIIKPPKHKVAENKKEEK